MGSAGEPGMSCRASGSLKYLPVQLAPSGAETSQRNGPGEQLNTTKERLRRTLSSPALLPLCLPDGESTSWDSVRKAPSTSDCVFLMFIGL